MTLHAYTEPPPTAGRARCHRDALKGRDPAVKVAGGYVLRAWGEAPNWQAWRGQDELVLVGTFATEREAREVL